MLLQSDFLKEWEAILEGVDKQQIPIECVKKVIFRTQDRRQKTINLNRLRSQGFDEETVESAVSKYLHTNSERIVSMEFVLDVERVANHVQPETDRILKGM